MKAFVTKFPSLISRKRLQYRTGRGSEDGVFSKHVDRVRLALSTAGLLILAGLTMVTWVLLRMFTKISDGKPSDQIETINLREPANRFQPLPKLPYPIACATTLLTKDSYYLFGGISSFGPTSSCFKVYFERDPNCILFDDLANKTPTGIDPAWNQGRQDIFLEIIHKFIWKMRLQLIQSGNT